MSVEFLFCTLIQKLQVNTKTKLLAIIFTVLIIDQALKIYIKTHFQYGEDMPLFGSTWAYFNFVENKGNGVRTEPGEIMANWP